MEQIVIYLLMILKLLNSKQDSKILTTPLCIGNISKELSLVNMKRTRFNGCIYDFSVDYDAIAVDDMLDIRKYLMKKNNMI